MKYLCLGYHDPRKSPGVSDAERRALREEWAALHQVVRDNGQVLAAEAVGGDGATTTLRFEKGKVSVTAGPPDDVTQQMDGVLLLEAEDLNRAIQLMAQLPLMRFGGSLEIRPIRSDLLRFFRSDDR